MGCTEQVGTDLVQNQVFQKFSFIGNSWIFTSRTTYIGAVVLIYPGSYGTLVGLVKYSLTVFKLFMGCEY